MVVVEGGVGVVMVVVVVISFPTENMQRWNRNTKMIHKHQLAQRNTADGHQGSHKAYPTGNKKLIAYTANIVESVHYLSYSEYGDSLFSRSISAMT